MSKRLLLIEDDNALSTAISHAIIDAGFTIDLAEDGKIGLGFALGNEYAAILLDLAVPKLSGTEILREVRLQKRTPVLVISANSSVDDRIAVLEAGADDFLVKPVTMSEIVARVRALIRRSSYVHEDMTPERIVLGEVVIDRMTKMVTRGGQQIDLRPREYELLDYLAVNRGRLVTRLQVYEFVFADTGMGVSNLCDVHMSNLRRKLGADLIETRRGMGYLIPDPTAAAEN